MNYRSNTLLATSLILLAAMGTGCLSRPIPTTGTVTTIIPSGGTDCTAEIQARLDSGPTTLRFPRGVHRMGGLKLGDGDNLIFEPGAVWKVTLQDQVTGIGATLGGRNIGIRGATFDLSEYAGRKPPKKQLWELFSATDCQHLRLTELTLHRPHEGQQPVAKRKGWQADLVAIYARGCDDVEVDHCDVVNIGVLVKTTFCNGVSVHENRAEWAQQISVFGHGSRDVRHYSNWSRNVTFQCQWWGGDANDVHSWVPDNTANVVRPDLPPDDKDYEPHTAGVYNVMVQNNYAEYGMTLAWGAKARQVQMIGNTAKFMSDMAYDSEGDENVVIANNISINSKCAGIGCYFWTDKVLISGNVLTTLSEGDAMYQGNFIRLHSGGQRGPDHFGTGKCLVQGNLMVSELDKPRALLVEACRDVTIAGNKFSNGRISTNDWDEAHRITVLDNEFIWTTPQDLPAIKLVSKGSRFEAIVKDNVLTRRVEKEDPDQKAAAVLVRGHTAPTQIIDGNTIQGWSTALRCYAGKAESASRFVVRDNTTDGAMQLPPTTRTQGNIDLRNPAAGK